MFYKISSFFMLLICSVSIFCADNKPVAITDFKAGIFADETGVLPYGLPYRLFVPKDYNEKISYPLVLGLHGAGERGTDNQAQGRNGLLSWAQPAVQNNHPSFVLLPQCPQSAGTFQLVNTQNKYPTGTYDFAVDVAKAVDTTRICIEVGKHLRGKKDTFIICAQPLAKDGVVDFTISNIRLAQDGKDAGDYLNFKGLTIHQYRESFVYDSKGCSIPFNDITADKNLPALEGSVSEDGLSVNVKSTGHQLRLGFDMPCKITADTKLYLDFKSASPGIDNRIGWMADNSLPEYRWANTNWSQATSHTMPEQPSEPMRLTMSLLDSVVKDYNIDKDRIYVTGLSMGGYGTYDIIGRRPNYFAAAMPMCGGGDIATAPLIAHMPLWIFHGADDNVVPTNRSRIMVDALQKAGGDPRYTEYPGVNHFSWGNAYKEPELVNWLFCHLRGKSVVVEKK